MTDQEQRIAIAQACGLNQIEPLRRMTRKGAFSEFGVRIVYCSEHHGGASTWEDVPDYLGDLNAIHEAEKACLTTFKLVNDYELHVAQIRARAYDPGYPLGLGCTFATARQRAEAFLRTLNLWKAAI